MFLNHQISMISERSCEIENLSNDCITGINNILKYIQIEKSYFIL